MTTMQVLVPFKISDMWVSRRGAVPPSFIDIGIHKKVDFETWSMVTEFGCGSMCMHLSRYIIVYLLQGMF